MSHTVSILILCEDAQASLFILDALEEAGVDVRRAYVIPYPGRVFRKGESGPKVVEGWTVYSCGSQHVRESYPRLVRMRRIGEARLRTMGCRAVVQIDVDSTPKKVGSVADRRMELVRACQKQAVSPPDLTELVAHLISRRNIETWIRFLLIGDPVDENEDYRHLKRPSRAEPAAASFARHARAGTEPTGAPPSLLVALPEFRKVL